MLYLLYLLNIGAHFSQIEFLRLTVTSVTMYLLIIECLIYLYVFIIYKRHNIVQATTLCL